MRKRAIRVFISSTFNDMQKERDELSLKVFPRLRKLCEHKGVIFSEVDLRWGITEQESREGMVLPICLDEIDKSSPFFICFLGNRYGWIPDTHPDHLYERYAWLKDFPGTSITELEVQYGVFDKKRDTSGKFFYFRKSESSKITEQGADYCHDEKIKLENLKYKIQKSGVKLLPGYRDATHLGELVYQDFSEEINRLFPNNDLCNPESRESYAHYTYAISKADVYIGRSSNLHTINTHIKNKNTKPLVITGDSGCGKSALLSAWLWSNKQIEHESGFIVFRSSVWSMLKTIFGFGFRGCLSSSPVNCLYYFVGATYKSTDWRFVVKWFISELDKRYHLNISIPDNSLELIVIFSKCLYLIKKCGPIILIIDGLDHLDDIEQGHELMWLPEVVPSHVKLIVSTSAGASLKELQRRKCTFLKIRPFASKERSLYLEAYLVNKYRKKLPAHLRKMVIGHKLTGSPQFLQQLSDELRIFGRHEELEQKVSSHMSVKSQSELYFRILERLENSFQPRDRMLFEKAITLIALSRKGLYEHEILVLLGEDLKKLPLLIWQGIQINLTALFAHTDDRTQLKNKEIEEIILSRYVNSVEDRYSILGLLTSYFERSDNPQRKYDELPYYWVSLEHWDKLLSLLVDTGWLSQNWQSRQYEIMEYWSLLQKNTDHTLEHDYIDLIADPSSAPEAAWAVFVLLNEIQSYRIALELGTKLGKLAEKQNDLIRFQAILGQLGILYCNQGELQLALTHFQRQESICRQCNYMIGLSASLSNQGAIYQKRGNLEIAESYFKKSEQLSEEIDDLGGLAASYGNQSTVELERGNYSAARKLLEKQEGICRKLGDLQGLQEYYGNSGVLHLRTADYAQALKFHEKEEAICRKLNNTLSLQICLGNKAGVMMSIGNYDAALVLLDERECLCQEINCLNGYVICLLQKAYLFGRKMGNASVGFDFIEKAKSSVPSDNAELMNKITKCALSITD